MKRERGQALVEFAIVLPIIIGVLGAIAYFGLLYSHKLSVTQAVKDAARMETVCNYKATNPGYVDPVTKFQNEVTADGMNVANASTNQTSPITCPASGTSFTFTGSYHDTIHILGYNVTSFDLTSTVAGVAE